MDDSVRLGLKKPSEGELQRGFGTGLTIVLFLLALLSWRRGGKTAPVYLLAGLAACAIRLLRPSLLGALQRPWSKAAAVLGEFNTTLLTVMIYYFVITPYALFLKIIGRDPLARENDGGGWIARDVVSDYKSYERQF